MEIMWVCSCNIRFKLEKWAIQKEKEQARLNEQIKNGKYFLY
jgi:hypothetical protein